MFSAGVVAEIENFKRLIIHKGRRRIVKHFSGKGHEEEMRAWASFLAAQAPHPQPFEDIRRSTLLTFALLEAIRERRSVDPREPDQEQASATASSEAAAQSTCPVIRSLSPTA